MDGGPKGLLPDEVAAKTGVLDLFEVPLDALGRAAGLVAREAARVGALGVLGFGLHSRPAGGRPEDAAILDGIRRDHEAALQREAALEREREAARAAALTGLPVAEEVREAPPAAPPVAITEPLAALTLPGFTPSPPAAPLPGFSPLPPAEALPGFTALPPSAPLPGFTPAEVMPPVPGVAGSNGVEGPPGLEIEDADEWLVFPALTTGERPDRTASQPYRDNPEWFRGRPAAEVEAELDRVLVEQGRWFKDIAADGNGVRYFDGI